MNFANKKIAVVLLACLVSIAGLAPASLGAGKVDPVKVTFKKGKLIEVAFMSVKKGKQPQLNEYFRKVMPLATKYGIRPLITLRVSHAYSKKIGAQMIGFFEWPSKRVRADFAKNKQFNKIKHLRNNSLSVLKVGYFESGKDVSVLFFKDKLYEVYGLWANKKNRDKLDSYFKQSGEIITQDYGASFVLDLQATWQARGYYNPEMFGIVQWESKKLNSRFFNSGEYKSIEHLKKAGLARLDVWHTSVMPH